MKPFGCVLTCALALAAFISLGADDALRTKSVGKPDVSLEGVGCLFGDDPADEKLGISYKGGKLYFCCKDCAQKFKKDPARYAVEAHRQLVKTGQAEQTKCPLTGKAFDTALSVDVAGSKVNLCCQACQTKLEAANDDARLELVFANKPFARGFKLAGRKAVNTSRTPADGKKDVEISEQAVQQAIAIQERNTARLMQIRGVIGTAVGANEQGQPVIKLLVDTPEAARNVPAAVEGIPVEVLITGPIKRLADGPTAESTSSISPHAKKAAAVNRTGVFPRPVPIGVSTGNAGECSAGTISCRIKITGGLLGAGVTNYYALSNNHVFALENNALLDSTLLQPGRYDTGCSTSSSNAIGTLSWKQDIQFGVNNQVDAALALTSKAKVGMATPADGYGVPNHVTVAAALNQKVQKYGRTTGLTTGKVTAINATVNVGYTAGTATFTGQVIAAPTRGTGFIKSGDSGSLMVTNNSAKNPVGLLFAANSNGTYCIASPINTVLQRIAVGFTAAGVAPAVAIDDKP